MVRLPRSPSRAGRRPKVRVSGRKPVCVYRTPEFCARPAARPTRPSDYRSKRVTPVNIATDTPGKSIAVGQHPAGIAVSPDGEIVYVASRWSGTVTVIDARTGVVEPTIKVGKGPWDVPVTP